MNESTRRPSSWRVVGRRLGWLGLVPGLFALNLCLPEAESLPTGIPQALGCSGSGGVYEQPDWSALLPAPTSEEGAPVPVDTNGFLLLHAFTHHLSAEQAQAQIVVRVTNAAGTELAGDLRLLDDRADPYTFGWSARTPLATGDRLT